jgi:DhnA family fructose-bisphosphate aldolase class Ia
MGFRKARMNRLFAKTGKCFDVAVDHGFFNEGAFLGGIEDLGQAVKTIVDAGPDAIQLTVGQARLLQDILGPRKPALVLRTDVANVYNPKLHDVLFSKMIDDPVEQAVELDAAGVDVNLLLLPNQPDLHGQCIERIAALKPKCDRYGMPLMIEPLVMLPNDVRGGYQVDGDADKIVTLVRLAAEMGADIIKADPTTDADDFHRVIEAARVPVLVRGGGKEDLRSVLGKSAALLAQGACGLVYGRNIYQHDNPKRVVAALMAMIHRHVSGDEAWEIYQNG